MSATQLAVVAGLAAAAGILDLAEARARRPRRPTRRRHPLLGLFGGLGRRFGAPGSSAGLPERIAAAGATVAPEELLAVKTGAAAAAGMAALPWATEMPGRLGLLMPVAAAAVAFAGPDLWLRRRTRHRVQRAEAELADVADLLRVGMEAGLPARRALAEVARRHRGLLSLELGHVAGLLEFGVLRTVALETLARRLPSTGVAALIATLDRSESQGTPPGEALAALAREARSDRSRAVAEAAARAAPQIQLVVALLLVPSVLLLVAAALVPAVL